MGGYGSGRRFGAKRQVESCLALSSSSMLQDNLLDLELGRTRVGDFSWSNCLKQTLYILFFELARVSTSQMRLNLYTTKQVVFMNPTAMRFGGVRWWFSCQDALGAARSCIVLRTPSFCAALATISRIRAALRENNSGIVRQPGAEHGLSAAEIRGVFAGPVWARSSGRRKPDGLADY
jgi:hypothetical protein